MMPEFSGSLDADLARIVRDVFQTMMGYAAEPATHAEFHATAPLTAAVHYAGAWKGALVIECSGRQAARWAEGFMPLTGPATSEDARDGLAEIANVIAGNLKPFLPPGASLSMPSVIEGTDHKLRLPESCHREAFLFADEADPFRISLAVFR